MKRPRRAIRVTETSPQPALGSKRRRDEIRARWRQVIVEEFYTPSAFRYAWPDGTRGQRTAETVYRFLQGQANPKTDKEHGDPKISTVLAFAQMTRRSVGFLLTGVGAERDGESRPRNELADDVSVALLGAIPEALREYGFRIDGLCALAFLWIKIQNTTTALTPLVEIGSAMSRTSSSIWQQEKALAAIEAASRNATADCPGLLALDTRVPLLQAIAGPSAVNANPALRPTVDAMLSLARAKAEKSGMIDDYSPESV